MRTFLICALLLGAPAAEAGRRRGDAEILTVRAQQAELRGRPSLDATVMGLVRRGETVELVRASADKRWVEVDIGGGELAWIEARAVKAGAALPEPEERRDTMRMNRPAWARAEREEPTRRTREEPREVRDDPPPRRMREEPPPRIVREEPPPRVVREEPPPPKREEARKEPPPPPKVAKAPPPHKPDIAHDETPEPVSTRPAAKPGETFAADLDDERPPTKPGEATKRVK